MKNSAKITLLAAIAEYIAHQENKIGLPKPYGITQETHDCYLMRFKTLKEYFAQVNRPNILLVEFRQTEAFNLMKYLAESKMQNTVTKYLKFIKSAMLHARDYNGHEVSSFIAMKLYSEIKTPTFLTVDEVKLLVNQNIEPASLQRVKDLFIVQCFTGFAYEDLRNFNKTWIYIDNKHRYFINYKRGKNSVRGLLPLFKEANDIFEKYNYKLPVISNQKYNNYLKDLAAKLDIETHLTTHVGRKTFGATLLNEGFSLETVSKMLAHSTTNVTQKYYAEILEKRILHEIEHLKTIRKPVELKIAV